MKIKGVEIAERIYQNLEKRIAELKIKNIVPHLAVILVGENPASVAYVTLKQKKGEAIGAKFSLIRYETSVTIDELLEKIDALNQDKKVHGILIQRPLPEHIDVQKLELTTNPAKDIDGFHPESPFILPLPLAVVKILEEVHRLKNQDEDFINWLQSKNTVVLGKGPTGGGPVIKLLNKMGVSPVIIDSNTKNPNHLMKKADIIISSVGRENVVKPESIKKGVILIGVGILRGEDGRLKGDYDPAKIENIAGFYTPTPGGVGPVNVAMLWDNLLTAAEHQST